MFSCGFSFLSTALTLFQRGSQVFPTAALPFLLKGSLLREGVLSIGLVTFSMRGGSCISDWGDSFPRRLLIPVRGEYFFLRGLTSSLSVSSFSFAVLTFSARLRLFASRGVNSPLSRLPLFQSGRGGPFATLGVGSLFRCVSSYCLRSLPSPSAVAPFSLRRSSFSRGLFFLSLGGLTLS